MSDSGLRGQTTIDFAIGASIFLLAAAFVVAFVPTMLDPYVGKQDAAIVADRTADRLAGDVLASPDTPYVLDRACTDEFFDADGVACRADTDAADLNAAVGAVEWVSLNVTVTDGTGAAAYAAGDDYEFAGGRVITADRTVLLDGRPYELHVRAWT